MADLAVSFVVCLNFSDIVREALFTQFSEW